MNIIPNTETVDRIRIVYEQYGLIPLFLRSSRSLTVHILDRLEELYWELPHRTQNFNVGDLSAEYYGSSKLDGGKIRSDVEGGNDMLEEFVREIQPSDVVYDIGAHVGLFTIFSAKAANAGHVVAFEPHPVNAAAIGENARLNQVSVEICEIALSDENSKSRLSVPDSSKPSVSNSLAEDNYDTLLNDFVTVESRRGDDFIKCEDVPQPTILKIDVEGAEGEVLSGLEKQLNTSVRAVFVELHLPTHGDRPSINDFDWTRDEIEQKLRSFGFKITVLNERNHDIHLKAIRNKSKQ